MHSNPVTPPGVAAMTVISFFLLLEVIVVGFRLWPIHSVKRPFYLHDVLILLALIISCAHVAVVFMQIVGGGLGHHTLDLPPSSQRVFHELFPTAAITSTTAIFLIRSSVLMLYLDIFPTHKNFKRIAFGLETIVVATFVGIIVSIFTACRPFRHYWVADEPGACGNLIAHEIAMAAINTVVDMSIILLPLPIVLRLELTTSQKRKVFGVFGVGVLIGLIDISHLVLAIVLDERDPHNLTGPGILTSLELQLSIIAAGLLSINPVLNYIRKRSQGHAFSPSSTFSLLIPSCARLTYHLSSSNDSSSTLTPTSYLPVYAGGKSSGGGGGRQTPYDANDTYFLNPDGGRRGPSNASAVVQVESVSNTKNTRSQPSLPDMSSYRSDAIVVTRDVIVEVKPGSRQVSPV